MKLIFPVIFVAIIITALVIKNQYSKKLKDNAEMTSGTVIEVFYKGKLPYCTYTFRVDGKTYKRDHFLPKHLIKKAKGVSYQVKYDKTDPSNAVILFDEKVQ